MWRRKKKNLPDTKAHAPTPVRKKQTDRPSFSGNGHGDEHDTDRIAISTEYCLQRKIATGGMGAIYAADQYGVDGFVKRVALKLLRKELSESKEFVSMFIGEARLVSGLVHQNIVQIYQLGKFENNYFIAMEYIDGIDLEQFMTRHAQLKRSIPIELCVYIVSRICRGLEYAHNKRDERGELLDIVHRDVSPRNIMITNEGEVKLADFGVAKARRYVMKKLRDNVMVGKLAYMSPEQATARKTDSRSDIFSLGIILYELLTGTQLFDKDSETDVTKLITEGPTPDPRQDRADIPDNLLKILNRCLERDPSARYQAAGDLGYDLEYHIYSGGYGPTIVTLAKYAAELYPRRKFYVAPSRGDDLSRDT